MPKRILPGLQSIPILAPRASLALFLFPALAVILYLPILGRQWEHAKGYEYEWVAKALADGHGYSFDKGTAWLGPYPEAGDWVPTAWIEPVQTAIMALCFSLFGDRGQLVLTLLNAIWFGLASAMILILVGRLAGLVPGILMATVYLLLPFKDEQLVIYIGNAPLAGFLVTLCAYLFVRCLESPSYRRCVTLGAAVAVSGLTHAGLLLFALPMGILFLARHGFRESRTWRHLGAGLVVVIAVMSPWVARNAATFGQLIPVRNGIGFNSFLGNVGLAETIRADRVAQDAPSESLWTATSPRDALWQVHAFVRDRDLQWFCLAEIKRRAPEDYLSFNEAQRDKFILAETMTFIRAQPMLCAQLAFWKLVSFAGDWGWLFRLTAIGAVLGWLSRRRDPRVTSIALLIAAYLVPYAVSLPHYYRYRFPIEALFLVLCGVLIGSLTELARRWLGGDRRGDRALPSS